MIGIRKLVVALAIYAPLLAITSVGLFAGYIPAVDFVQLHVVVAPLVLGLFTVGNSYERRLGALK